MTNLAQRAALVDKLQALKTHGAGEDDNQVKWLRSQIRACDLQLLADEVERLKQAKYSFKGSTLEESLGCDAWILH